MKANSSAIIIILASLLLTQLRVPAFAGDQFLDACLQIAQARDKRLAVAKEQVGLSQVRLTRSARAFFPSVMAQRKFARGKVSVSNDEYQSEDLGLRVFQPLYQGGRQMATYRYDNLMKESARYNYTKVREELLYNVKLAYYEVQALRTEYIALTKAFEEVDALMKKVRIEYNAKAISELELTEAENFRDKIENLLKASELNLDISTRKLTVLVNVSSLDDIPAVMPDGLSDNIPEITFTLDECKGFIATNNLDAKIAQNQVVMSNLRKAISRSKVIPKLFLDGFYGQSGEAFVKDPLDLTTVWTIAARLSWGLWGNSLEIVSDQERTDPKDIVNVQNRTESSSLEVKLGLLDDLDYFVDDKESKVTYQQSVAEYRDTLNKMTMGVEKIFADYVNSLHNARTLRKEITLKERKLQLMRKRNSLYEIPTVSVMEESWKYAEVISSYGRAIYSNYSSVTELERMTLMTLR